MEPNDRPIRIPIVVDRLSRPDNLIRQRDEVPNGRARANVFEVRASVRRQTLLPKRLQLCIRLRYTGVKLFELVGIPKVGRDGLVDGPHDGVVPECKLFRVRAEANCVTRAASERGAAGFRGKGNIIGSTRHEFSDCKINAIKGGHRFRVKSWSTFELCSAMRGETHNV
jgi:hypothetical protein